MDNITIDILIKYLPDIFASVDSKIQFHIPTDLKPLQEDINLAKTTDKWSLAEEKVHIEQIIQAQVFERYCFDIIFHEDVRVGTFLMAQYVKINTSDDKEFLCFDFQIEEESNNQTGFIKYTLSFSVKNQNNLSYLLVSDVVKLQEVEGVKINTIGVTVAKPYFIQYQPVIVAGFTDEGNPYTSSTVNFDITPETNIIQVDDILYVEIINSNFDPAIFAVKCHEKTAAQLKFHFTVSEHSVVPSFGGLSKSEVKISYEPGGYGGAEFDDLITVRPLTYQIYTKIDPINFIIEEKPTIENKRNGITLLADTRAKQNSKIPIYLKDIEFWKIDMLKTVLPEAVKLTLSDGTIYYNVDNFEFIEASDREDLINIGEWFLNFKSVNSVNNLYR